MEVDVCVCRCIGIGAYICDCNYVSTSVSISVSNKEYVKNSRSKCNMTNSILHHHKLLFNDKICRTNKLFSSNLLWFPSLLSSATLPHSCFLLSPLFSKLFLQFPVKIILYRAKDRVRIKLYYFHILCILVYV